MFHTARTLLVLISIAALTGIASPRSGAWIDELAAGNSGAAGRGLNEGWVGCSTTDSCFPFDLDSYATGASLSLLPEGDYPYDATMTPDGSEVWFVGAGGDGAVVVDRATNTIIHRIPTGEYPTSIAFSDDGALALVSCRDTESVTIIDTGSYTVSGSLQLPPGYDGGNIALDPVSKLFYLVDWYDNTIFEIAADGSAILRQVDIGSSLWQLVVSPDGQHIYVTDRGTDLVRIVERATLSQVATVPVGDDPWGIDITADGGTLVVTCEDSHNVCIIDTGTLDVTLIALASTADPRDVDILDSRLRAFVCGGTVGTTSHPVYVIDLTDNTIETVFEANGSNTNVVAVQAQMHSGGAGSVWNDPSRRSGLDLRAHPNPAPGRTELSYALAEAGEVDLAIFDGSGRKVRQLVAGLRAAGPHRLLWDAADEEMRPLGGGVYFARILAGGERREMKLVIQR
ncbi:MAG: beta-propeller fold lactonase family protein [Candidatus Eisenbacteria bacterium]|uniref:Beta-propeller fold lactonase family protein n=1 Tax=Eiseniibacteriota bacterium TaxID=2212470 RepID=A0A937XAS8_UNCEI|nr:beta-propeller fold lactonase family protein [Candidatus Eisenbacteria bacterium]